MDFKQEDLQKNADRFLGFAALYHRARPRCPRHVAELARLYLGRRPETVVDLGCGTGLSTLAWRGECSRAVGVEPSADMGAVARENFKGTPGFEVVRAFANETPLPGSCADVVMCSQSFHWMEPESTLKEAARILAPGGVFMTVDCDWPPVTGLAAERAYRKLFAQVQRIERESPLIKDTFRRWEKENHLRNIRESGRFSYVREIVFSHTEKGGAQRLIALALSQGGLQAILKKQPESVLPLLREYEDTVNGLYGDREIDLEFCYRVRLGVK